MAPKKSVAAPKAPTADQVEADWQKQQQQWRRELRAATKRQGAIEEERFQMQLRVARLHHLVEMLEGRRSALRERSERHERSSFAQTRLLEDLVARNEEMGDEQKDKARRLQELLNQRRQELTHVVSSRVALEGRRDVAFACSATSTIAAMRTELATLRTRCCETEGAIESLRRDVAEAPGGGGGPAPGAPRHPPAVSAASRHGVIVTPYGEASAVAMLLARRLVVRHAMHCSVLSGAGSRGEGSRSVGGIAVASSSQSPASPRKPTASSVFGALERLNDKLRLISCELARDAQNHVADLLWGASHSTRGEKQVVLVVQGASIGAGASREVLVPLCPSATLSSPEPVLTLSVSDIVELALRQSECTNYLVAIDATFPVGGVSDDGAARPGFMFLASRDAEPLLVEFSAPPRRGALTSCLFSALRSHSESPGDGPAAFTNVALITDVRRQLRAELGEGSERVHWSAGSASALPLPFRFSLLSDPSDRPSGDGSADDDDADAAPCEREAPAATGFRVERSSAEAVHVAVTVRIALSAEATSEWTGGKGAGEVDARSVFQRCSELLPSRPAAPSEQLAALDADLRRYDATAASVVLIAFVSEFTATGVVRCVESALRAAAVGTTVTIRVAAASASRDRGLLEIECAPSSATGTGVLHHISQLTCAAISEIPGGSAVAVTAELDLRVTATPDLAWELLQYCAPGALMGAEGGKMPNAMCISAALNDAALVPIAAVKRVSRSLLALPPAKVREQHGPRSVSRTLLLLFVVDDGVCMSSQRRAVEEASRKLWQPPESHGGKEHSSLDTSSAALRAVVPPEGEGHTRRKLHGHITSARAAAPDHPLLSAQRRWTSIYAHVNWQHDLSHAPSDGPSDAAPASATALVSLCPSVVADYVATLRFPALIVTLIGPHDDSEPAPALVMPRSRRSTTAMKDGRCYFHADAIANAAWKLVSERLFAIAAPALVESSVTSSDDGEAMYYFL